ncbi:carbamoyltransferase HypF [Fodinicola acaciae]|uniref:carbamoyltransferase HypF n=1 Tax=Fodinicola acaciae TaxID=2681555 RepID=UPI0013D18015|nr:carbamoyltransferase HypF [Fodinicola acaciae]
MTTLDAITTRRIELSGTVQGVGFRPFVFRLAAELGLDGDVRNDGGTVVIRAAGPPALVDRFQAALVDRAPQHARVDGVRVEPLADPLPAGFHVLTSGTPAGGSVATPPDLATCRSCRAELFDPSDRRYRYPFITCTDCGPRESIVDTPPYDRARTSMRRFRMCKRCSAEYHDPGDRRFHAETIACADCGPRLRWHTRGRAVRGDRRSLAEAVRVIAAGGLIAVKGIGGYQLVCDATDAGAVSRLRAAKRRPSKPFAVMVSDVAAANQLAVLDEAATAELTSAAAPIVLLPRRTDLPLVAPGRTEIGVFLPYSPLHHLLLHDLDRPLVVTSGNTAGEPIAVDRAGASRMLHPLVDGTLDHDRQIRSRADDSVVRIIDRRPMTVRRARGHVPEPLPLPVPARRPILAVGAQLKNTAALAIDDNAMLTAHLGDLENTATFDAFESSISRLLRVHRVEPSYYAHDLHPGYLSTAYARRWPADRRIVIQHHHAHVVATAAEHGVTGPFIGIAYDGLGMGDDGTLWGGEILLADYTGYRRIGRVGTAPLPGGSAAVRRPARMALGYLYGAEELCDRPPIHGAAAGFVNRLPRSEVATIRQMVTQQVNSPRASSVGRLFDAMAALLGVCDDVSYEGEAAVLLEAAAAGFPDGPTLHWRLVRRDGLHIFDPVSTIHHALELATTEPVGSVAARFHRTLVEATLAMVTEAARRHRVRTVCLGGGVFANRRLAAGLLEGLAGAGLVAHIGERVPVNDGGISYGQAVVAAARLRGR